ncbi:MAG TPA: polyphosphate kinase 1 [Saprospiraceae bacterium]|nr:polyphosphate kinase 1 [Saprospiraceae bacterium]MCB9327771.1 polyphosphate kinase 1 [Lewinellaceae bacterium]HPQ21165.1 polyphosphate kinase 1 [Saprospiraceae bacterium]HRX29482.1 polyphosphate kinase 1 [Saprospiraceae bacterium]
MSVTPLIHRDVSWLSFNYRVLQESMDASVPLLERVKFLAIYSSNLDEFFRVRVANHRSLIRASKKTRKDLNFEPEEVLTEILSIVNSQQELFSDIFENQIIPQLKRNKINIVKRTELTPEQIEYIEHYFNDHMLPFVQPVLMVGKKIKPFLNNAALYLALYLIDKEANDEKPDFGFVKIPSDHLPRFIVLPPKKEGQRDIIIIDDIVRHSIALLFPGFHVKDTYSIKLTRDAELYIDDEYSGDLLDKIKKSLIKRNIGTASRLVYDRTINPDLLKFIMDVFELEEFDLSPEGRYHNNSDFFKFPDFNLQHLKNVPLPPLPIRILEESEDIFKEIIKKDHFIHLPYHSYESVIKFFESAAVDVNVTHIKIIQYRVASISRIMKALKLAVKNGKQVSAFVEIKARFDEEANLKWGEELESAGVNVRYSLPGYKVHSKLALVRRIESAGSPMLYCYMGTGNFHEDTAKIYCDMGIFTTDQRLTSEAARIFSYLETKQLPNKPFEQMGVGLFNLKPKLLALIDREIENAQKKVNAYMILKMNSLQDEEMINKLYEASQAGVKIQLIIRGICCLVPNVENISENISSISIVDRFLEHARVFVFGNGGKEEIYLSSADWMVRNLHYRIETMFPILDLNIKNMVRTCLNIQLNDNIKARILDGELTNEYKRNTSDLSIRSQVETYYYTKRMEEKANQDLLKEKEK